MLGNSFAQESNGLISENFKEVTLDEALQTIGRKYDTNLAYNSRAFKQIIVTVVLNDLTTLDALNELTEKTNYKVKKVGNTFVFYPFLATPRKILPTEKSNFGWSSVVKDFDSYEPLPFAVVVVLATGEAVNANEDGRFTLQSIPTDTSTLLVSYVGYNRKKIKLQPSIIELNRPLLLVQNNALLVAVPIYGEQNSLLSINQTIQEIDVNLVNRIPNPGEQDIFNTIQLLPGIGGTGERAGKINIRGGADDENLVMMDGFTLYHIDHFYQLYSAINSTAVKHIRVHKGWFEPKYGGRASGIIEIQGKEGNINHSTTSIGMNFNSANLFFESPLEKGKSSVVIAARRSFSDLYSSYLHQSLFNSVYNQSTQNINTGNAFDTTGSPSFKYADVNLKFNFILSEKTKVNFSFFYSNDDVFLKHTNDVPELGVSIKYNNNSTWSNQGYSTKWTHQWADRWYSNITVGYSNYTSKTLARDIKTDLWFNTIDTVGFDKNTVLTDFSLRLNNDLFFNRNTVSFGINHTLNQISFKSISSEIAQEETFQSGALSTFYLQDKLALNNFEILAGIRLSYYSLLSEVLPAPRISFKYNFGNKWITLATYGHNYQVIRNTHRQGLLSSTPDEWKLADSELPVIHSKQYGLEISKEMENFHISGSFYHRNITGSIYNLNFSPLNFSIPLETTFSIGEKEVNGVDFQVIKPYGKHKGWLSLSVSKINQINHDIIPFDFIDSDNNMMEGKVAYTYSSRKWVFGAIFIYGSGKPYTKAIGTYDLELINGEIKKIVTYDMINSGRLKEYHRLDLSLSKHFIVQGKVGEIGLSIFNVYNRRNTSDIRYFAIGRDSENYSLIEKDIKMLGFTPGLKFKYTF